MPLLRFGMKSTRSAPAIAPTARAPGDPSSFPFRMRAASVLYGTWLSERTVLSISTLCPPQFTTVLTPYPLDLHPASNRDSGCFAGACGPLSAAVAAVAITTGGSAGAGAADPPHPAQATTTATVTTAAKQG